MADAEGMTRDEIRAHMAHTKCLLASIVGNLLTSLLLNRELLRYLWEDSRCQESQSDACEAIRELREWVSSKLGEVEEYVREMTRMDDDA